MDQQALSSETRAAGAFTSVVDVADFNERVVGAYNNGLADKGLPADGQTARSIVPAATGALRDFSYIAPEIPEFIAGNCVGCMECVVQCPDTAILGKVAEPSVLEGRLARILGEAARADAAAQWAVTNKYFTLLEKKGVGGGKFGIFIDPTKCKGCAECVDACGDHNALRMVRKSDKPLEWYRRAFDFYRSMPETPARFINEKALADMMLAERSLLYVGGAGSCMGCGEATALRMMLAATGFLYGQDKIGIVAATGCNTVYTSTYPYNPYRVSWTNSLFENAPADAMGVRARWDQLGWKDKRLWVVGGDGAMLDIGFQSLSRMLASGMDIKVLVLDTQVYSNTGGQNSDSTPMLGGNDMNVFGAASQGKNTEKKTVAETFLAGHGSPFVAQISIANAPRLYKAILDGLEYRGTAFLQCFTTCQPEHGVADDMALTEAQRVRDSRGAPEFVFNPRLGETYQEALDLKGNPSIELDWYEAKIKGSNEPYRYTVAHWCATEARFRNHLKKISAEDAAKLISLDNMLARITQQDVVYRRYLRADHRSYVPDFGVYIKLPGPNGEIEYRSISRQLTLFCVERRKAWRMLQSKAGIRNKEYLAQRSILADFDAGKLSQEELFAHGEELLKERVKSM